MGDTLKAWKRAQEQLEQAGKDIDTASEALEAAGCAHRTEHPLDDRTKNAIIEACANGKPLCCKEGRAVLQEIGLDEYWTEFISDWAYEHIGCVDWWKPGGKYYERGLRELRDFLGRMK